MQSAIQISLKYEYEKKYIKKICMFMTRLFEAQLKPSDLVCLNMEKKKLVMIQIQNFKFNNHTCKEVHKKHYFKEKKNKVSK